MRRDVAAQLPLEDGAHLAVRRAASAVGVVVARPRGVFWARTGRGPHDPMCEAADHAVSLARHTRPVRGCPSAWETVDVWACRVCWPEGAER